LLNRALKALGKSLMIVTGVGYGVIKAMDVLASEDEAASDPLQGAHHGSTESNPSSAPSDPAIQRLDGMLDGVEQRLIRMEKSIEALALVRETAQPKPAEQFITRADLDRAMQQLSDEIGADVDRRFEVQNRSVQSLRAMIARTDELLEQVIENIESTQLTA
jgi:hypothetical protein